jgi:hypothetical protein
MAGVIFLIAAGLTPVVIAVFAALAYLGSPAPRAAVVLRGVFALGLWFIVTLTLILVFFMIVYGAFDTLPTSQANATVNGWLLAFLVGYLIVCDLLIWWASWKRRAASEN